MNRLRSASIPLLALLAIILLPACDNYGSGPGEGESGIELRLDFPAGFTVDRQRGEVYGPSGPNFEAAPANVTGVVVTITGNGIDPIIHDVPLATGIVEGTVPPGEYTFFVIVNTDSGTSFYGSANAILVAGDNNVVITLEISAPPSSDAGLIVSNSTPAPDEPVTLSVVLANPSQTSLFSFAWNGGGGTIAGSGDTVIWSASAPGSYTVTVTMSSSAGASFTASAVITITNLPPEIIDVSVSDAAPLIGDVIILTCGAFDPEGGSLTYDWYVDGIYLGSGSIQSYTVTSGSAVKFTCEVIDSGGEMNSGEVTIGGGTVGAPAGVVADAEDTEIIISWDTVTGATSYNIYWNISGSVDPSADTAITGVTSPYTHTGLTNGLPYYYIVTAVGPSGESGASAEVFEIPYISTPTGVGAANIGGNTNQVTYNAVAGASGYNIYFSLSSPVDVLFDDFIGSGGSPHNISPLASGTYYYVVTAFDAFSESDPSSEVSATVP